MAGKVDEKKVKKLNLVPHVTQIQIQSAHCSKGCDLMTEEVKIRGMKSIKVKIKWKDKEGLIYLDPEFGSYKHVSEIDVPDGEIVEFFCPHCGTSLKNEEEICRSCSAPTFVFDLPGEGEIVGCLRKGCFEHTLKIVSFNSMHLEVDENFIKMIM
ncbi:MAG: hypothetical protein J7K33_10725 [Candidatus Marinimicrobia bacterium]|nr:hypothetical protein [Candidatus Neomarinimicrobiota bacterium]